MPSQSITHEKSIEQVADRQQVTLQPILSIVRSEIDSTMTRSEKFSSLTSSPWFFFLNKFRIFKEKKRKKQYLYTYFSHRLNSRLHKTDSIMIVRRSLNIFTEITFDFIRLSRYSSFQFYHSGGGGEGERERGSTRFSTQLLYDPEWFHEKRWNILGFLESDEKTVDRIKTLSHPTPRE